MQINIINEPENVNDFQYLVITRAFDMENTFFYYGGFNDKEEAEDVASHIAGFVIYNVEFQFDTKKEKSEKSYCFSGYWYYSVKAKDLKEAKKKFNEAPIDEIVQNAEINFDCIDYWEEE